MYQTKFKHATSQGHKIVRDEAQRKLDDALNQARSREEKAIAQHMQIDNLQCQLNQLTQLGRQQQQTPTNIATPQHNIVIHTNTHRICST